MMFMIVLLALGYAVLLAGQLNNANRIKALEDAVFEDEDVWEYIEGDNGRAEE
jgi:hypothetical protein